jgi:hypothetical protein
MHVPENISPDDMRLPFCQTLLQDLTDPLRISDRKFQIFWGNR